MATDLIMPTLPDQQQQQMFYHDRPMHQRSVSASSANYVHHGHGYYHQHHYNHHHHHPRQHSQNVSPSTSAGNVTPTQGMPSTTMPNSSLPSSSSAGSAPSPKSSYHARQVRPLYMPAVLRPTEFPSKMPKKTSDEDDASLRRASGSFMSLAGLSVLGQRLTRRSTAESSRSGDDADLDLFPRVSALPTRRHWKPDPLSTICDDPSCKRNFSYWTRRHHCRKCGNIFCDWHSSFNVPLDEEANYNPRGSPSRSCHGCFAEFKDWRSRNNSLASSAASSDAAPTTPVTPTGTATGSSPAAMSIRSAATAPPVHSADAAASVPRDWNWSTF